MSRCMCVALLWVLTPLCTAQTPPLVPPEVLAQIVDEPNPLPRYLTPQERELPIPIPVRGGTPPTGLVRTPPEYEPGAGLFIAWEGYNTILTQLAVGVTTNDPLATIYVVVDSTSEQSSAAATLQSAGALMDQVEFIVRTTDTVWIRDYGPRFIFEDELRAIVDHTYNRPRPNDNLLNAHIGQLWGEQVYELPLVHAGGNFHLFSNGDAFMSDLILDENPGLSEQDVIDYFAAYENVILTIYPGFPTGFDSTRHIDMWMLPLADDKIIIGEYSPSSGQPYQITEDAVDDLTARGYTVYRTPGWRSGWTHYTYTNAVILNNQVFISSFGGPYASQDAQALAVFQQAMPNHAIYQIDSSDIIGAAGALHCIVMHVPAYNVGPEPVVRVRTPDGGEAWTVGQEYDIRWSAYDDLGVTSIDIRLSIDGGGTFPRDIATGLANTGVYTWEVPGLASDECRVKVIAHDADGNSGEDMSNEDFTITPFGPRLIYEFSMDTDPGWSTQGQWAFGVPTGGGSYNGDPTSGQTGSNVYGYNLLGDYTDNMPVYYLSSTALDCTDLAGVELRFWRWLGIESASYDHANVQVSNDAADWTTVWEHSGGSFSESSWSQHVYDISAIADGQATVYIRWGMGPTDWSVTYPGWNIDDLQIVAVRTVTPGDLNCDGVLDAFDVDPFVLALTAPTGTPIVIRTATS